MDPAVAASAFTLLAVAELGDKTQLATLALAHRYPARTVLAGSFAAFALLNALAVSAGGLLHHVLPRPAVLLAAALAFAVFAWRTWREGERGDGGEEVPGGRRPSLGGLAASFVVVLLAELGDKTQLALVALAAGSADPLACFVGATAALWLLTGVAVWLGAGPLRRLPRRIVHRAAAILFALFALAALVGVRVA